ncbi:uncharacterized protein [Parasteatoda tepidariorum]|uniref:uncharacterized protein n=1 Tax=Parasteatoda tepidariorum TaxID=114398 RepID=UPI00077FC6C8|nr:uncharacterized protein LOC107452867 [Parasteatoda tepidariorum]
MISIKLLLIIIACFEYGMMLEFAKDYYMPCWKWGVCKADDAIYAKIRSCYASVPEKERIEITKKASETGVFEYPSDLDEFGVKFCKQEKDLQNRIAVELGRIGIDKYSEFCANPSTVDDCARYEKVMRCLNDNLDELHAEEFC